MFYRNNCSAAPRKGLLTLLLALGIRLSNSFFSPTFFFLEILGLSGYQETSDISLGKKKGLKEATIIDYVMKYLNCHL